MKIAKIFLLFAFVLFPGHLIAADFLFDEPVQTGINVTNASNVFTEIYEKLDKIQWSNKNAKISLESLTGLHPKAEVVPSGERLVLVWGDNIIANMPKPEMNDWETYGQITTAFVVRMRERDARLRALDETGMYNAVVKALLRGVGESGSYILPDNEKIEDELKILTTLGFEGGRDERGNFRITGVFKGGSADISGIKEGYIISEINGERVSNMSDADLRSVLNGYNSGTVKVKLLTPYGNKNVALRRASIVLADADIVYRDGNKSKLLEIIVHQVSDSTVDIVNEALAKHPDIDGIILDLRVSGGNDEKAAAKLAGLFVGQQSVMIISEPGFDDLEVIPGGNAVTDVPVVVLISDSTHGMAETIASTLYENNRGLLIGTPTSGHVRMAGRIPLSNGGVLELLNKSVKTGRGNMLDGRGMFPLVCLSNIQNTREQQTFFVNVINGQFETKDYNKDTNTDIKSLRRACPVIVSGNDEDVMAVGVAAEILTEKILYNQLMGL